MTIASSFPTVRPSLNLDFATTKTLDPRVTFSRAGAATYFDSTGVMRTAPAGVARFDHNPTTGESLGLLIEEARTNLLTYSEQFGNGAWNTLSANVTVTPDNIMSPYGDVTADRLTKTANAFAVRGQSITGAVGPYTGSVFVKDGNLGKVSIDIFDGTPSVLVRGIYDFSLNTFTALKGSASAFSSYVLPNGWVRISATATISVANPQIRVYPGNATEAIAGYVYIWGAQLEQAEFPTTYIPTTTTQITRAADLASMTGTNFSDWYNQSEGTFVVSVTLNNDPANATFPNLYRVGLDNANRISSFIYGNTNTAYLSVIASGAIQSDISNGADVSTGKFTVSSAFKASDFSVSVNGTTPTVDSTGTIPVVNSFEIGGNFAGSTPLNGTISRLTYYPKRLSNTNLQVLTS